MKHVLLNYLLYYHPYSTSHYHCGCHIVEDAPNSVNLNKSIFCEDTGSYFLPELNSCLYLTALQLRRVKASREVC